MCLEGWTDSVQSTTNFTAETHMSRKNSSQSMAHRPRPHSFPTYGTQETIKVGVTAWILPIKRVPGPTSSVKDAHQLVALEDADSLARCPRVESVNEEARAVALHAGYAPLGRHDVHAAAIREVMPVGSNVLQAQ